MTIKCQKVNQKKTINLENHRQLHISTAPKGNKRILPIARAMKFIKHFIITIVINALLLYVIANHVPQLWFHIGSVYQDSIIIFLALGFVFWIVNSLLRSILKALTLPIKYMTLGISWLVINVLLLYIFEQLINYANIGITIQLGTLTQVFILSLIVTFVHLFIKKII
jgi:putative membrane protein